MQALFVVVVVFPVLYTGDALRKFRIIVIIQWNTR
jgi:hypothetical protein